MSYNKSLATNHDLIFCLELKWFKEIELKKEKKEKITKNDYLIVIFLLTLDAL